MYLELLVFLAALFALEEKEMARIFGADSVGFLPLEGVFHLAEGGSCKGYCAACFNGEYPTDVPAVSGGSKYDRKISENKK